MLLAITFGALVLLALVSSSVCARICRLVQMQRRADAERASRVRELDALESRLEGKLQILRDLDYRIKQTQEAACTADDQLRAIRRDINTAKADLKREVDRLARLEALEEGEAKLAAEKTEWAEGETRRKEEIGTKEKAIQGLEARLTTLIAQVGDMARAATVDTPPKVVRKNAW